MLRGLRLRAAAAEVEGLRVDVNTPPKDLMIEPEVLAYVRATLGAVRIDTITYRSGLLGAVAELLDRFYADVPALADTDADGIFTIPELVTLLRASRGGAFHAWADPSKRRT